MWTVDGHLYCPTRCIGCMHPRSIGWLVRFYSHSMQFLCRIGNYSSSLVWTLSLELYNIDITRNQSTRCEHVAIENHINKIPRLFSFPPPSISFTSFYVIATTLYRDLIWISVSRVLHTTAAAAALARELMNTRSVRKIASVTMMIPLPFSLRGSQSSTIRVSFFLNAENAVDEDEMARCTGSSWLNEWVGNKPR